MRIVRGLATLLGEGLVTLGVVLLLFVGWQLWWTDVVADADAATTVGGLQQQFAGPGGPGPERPDQPDLGEAFAIVRIPRFGSGFARPLYEGTTRDVLERGIGHYAGTQLPGEAGNFAMAAHRTTYGKPFNRIAELRTGDVVLVETRTSWFVYRVTAHEIVPPSQASVLLPVPNRPGAPATGRLLTMTSCHPEFSARERYVVYAELAQTYPHAAGVPDDVLEVTG
jgi:sortase A